jgi:hypothetical protein
VQDIYGSSEYELDIWDYHTCKPFAKHNEEKILQAIDSQQTLTATERSTIERVIDWQPGRQLAALGIMAAAIKVPRDRREEVYTMLAEKNGERYSRERHLCVTLSTPMILSMKDEEELRSAKIVLEYDHRFGDDVLKRTFTAPVTNWRRSAFEEELQAHNQQYVLTLTLPQFCGSFRRIYHRQSNHDELVELFDRFMDTNPLRAPLPNHRALQFLKNVSWDAIPSWPKYGHAHRCHVSMNGLYTMQEQSVW